MMANSVVAFIEYGNGNGYHLSLLQRQITVPVHQSIVKGHQRPQCRLVQAVGFDDVVHTTPGTGSSFIYLGNHPGCFILRNRLDPGHKNWEGKTENRGWKMTCLSFSSLYSQFANR